MSNESTCTPCIRCGSTSIELYDCGYSAFNCGGGRCSNCGETISSSNLGCSPSKKELAAVWNRGNVLTDTERIDWLETNEAHLVTHREKMGDGRYGIWWNVVRKKKSISGHPLGSPRAAIDSAILSSKQITKGKNRDL